MARAKISRDNKIVVESGVRQNLFRSAEEHHQKTLRLNDRIVVNQQTGQFNPLRIDICELLFQVCELPLTELHSEFERAYCRYSG